MSRTDPFFRWLAYISLILCLTGCDPVEMGYYLSRSTAPSEGRVSFSPDGKHLICGIRGRNSGIYRMDKDWKNPTRLTTPKSRACDGNPIYTPDGLKIIYTRMLGCSGAEPGHLFIMNADGTKPTQLTSGDYLDTAPVFVPDGQRIYFLRTKLNGYQPVGAEIFSMKNDGSDLRKFPANDSWAGAPALSPDGNYLIFGSGMYLRIFLLETEQEIDAVKLHFKNIPQGSKFSASISELVYSPNGGSIFFTGTTASQDVSAGRTTAIYRCDLAGAAELIANVSMFGEGWPSVSPDGSTLIFLEYTGSLGHVAKSFWSLDLSQSDSRARRVY